MKLIGHEMLDMGTLITQEYDGDFTTLPFTNATFISPETHLALEELFSEYADFAPEVAPVIIYSREKVLQKVIPLRGYRTNGILVVMWGGYKNKDHWFEVAKGDYELDILDGKSVASLTSELAVELVAEPSNTSEMKKASPLSTLPLGKYTISNAKVDQAPFGLVAVIEIDDKEYRANKQLEGLLEMLGGSKGIQGGVEKATGLTLKVLEKGQTVQGHASVKVGLSK
jgi:hypothetical protein